MSDTEQFGLKFNPFHHLVKDENAPIWAGMPETKARIQDVVRSALPEDIGSSEFVILVGDWGSGKTHALRHFTHLIRQNKTGYSFYAGRTLRGDKNIFAELFLSLVDECGDTFFSELREKIKDSSAKAAKAESASIELRALADTIAESAFDPIEKPLISALLHRNAKVYLRQEAKTDASAATLMAALVKIMTTAIKGQPAPYPAVYVFVDEVEELLEQKPAISLSFWRSCRELINRIDGRFAMILAFSTETAVLDAAIPPALLERRTRPYIAVNDLDIAGAKQFVKDFLKESRVPGFNPPHPFYPFTEEAVDFMLNRAQTLLPRQIIMTMGRVFKRGRAKLDGQKEFSKEIAEEVLNEMGV